MFLRFILALIIGFSACVSYGADLLPVIKQRFFDANGDPLVGGKLYSYAAGTSTPKATYTTAAGSVANANPVILDANGEASVYINAENYKFVLKNSSDVTQYTVDNVTLPSVSALASAFYRDVAYLTSANSPFTVTSTYNGYLLSVDTSGGAVTINLPEISGLTLPFNVTVKRASGASNSVTIARAGTDTINLGTSKVLDVLGGGVQLVADDGKSPDDWAVLDFGTVADGAITAAKLAYSSVNGQTGDTAPANDDEVLTGDTSASGLKKVTRTNFLKHIVRSVSSTDTATNNDEVIVLSGASFTETLPTAAGISGKTLEFFHNGTSVSQVYTIDGNGAETIGGAATFALRFNGERLVIRSDGTNWKVLLFYSQGGVTSSSTAPEKVERFKYYTTSAGTVCSASPCDITSSLPGATITRVGAGDYSLNFAAGTWSSAPSCVVFPRASGGVNLVPVYKSLESTTVFTFISINLSSTATNSFGDIICMGPK